MATGKDVEGSDHGRFKVLYGICLVGLSKTTKTVSQNSCALVKIRNGHLPCRNIIGGASSPGLF
jgi:hypothetical protein